MRVISPFKPYINKDHYFCEMKYGNEPNKQVGENLLCRERRTGVDPEVLNNRWR